MRNLKAKGATTNCVVSRLNYYCKIWPTIMATPEALVKHWDQLSPSAIGHPASRTPDAVFAAIEACQITSATVNGHAIGLTGATGYGTKGIKCKGNLILRASDIKHAKFTK